LGEDEATAADGMAAGVGWDVEALGMAAVVVVGIVVVVAINGARSRLRPCTLQVFYRLTARVCIVETVDVARPILVAVAVVL
jgi:hypothetical protein